MKLWSSLFTSVVLLAGVGACAMAPEQGSGDEEKLGRVSQKICKEGTLCYDDGLPPGGDKVTDGEPQQTFECGKVPHKCDPYIAPDPDDPETLICVYGCNTDGILVSYNPCWNGGRYWCSGGGTCYCLR
jgi:hypothetical protein